LKNQKTLSDGGVVLGGAYKVSTWDIVDLSHKEKAWKELESTKQLIGYQNYAFELTTI